MDIRLLGSNDDKRQENGDADTAFQQILKEVALDKAEQPGQNGGQQHEKTDRHQAADNDGHHHQGVVDLLLAKLAVDPVFKLGGDIIFVIFKEGGRILQRRNAVFHRIPQIDGAADKGQLPEGSMAVGAHGLFLDDMLAILFTDNNGRFLGAAHQDALDQSLAADGGSFFDFAHRLVTLSPVSAGMVMMISVPSPYTLATSSVPS